MVELGLNERTKLLLFKAYKIECWLVDLAYYFKLSPKTLYEEFVDKIGCVQLAKFERIMEFIEFSSSKEIKSNKIIKRFTELSELLEACKEGVFCEEPVVENGPDNFHIVDVIHQKPCNWKQIVDEIKEFSNSYQKKSIVEILDNYKIGDAECII